MNLLKDPKVNEIFYKMECSLTDGQYINSFYSSFDLEKHTVKTVEVTVIEDKLLSVEYLLEVIWKLKEQYISSFGHSKCTVQLNSTYLNILNENEIGDKAACVFGLKLDHSFSYPINSVSIRSAL